MEICRQPKVLFSRNNISILPYSIQNYLLFCHTNVLAQLFGIINNSLYLQLSCLFLEDLSQTGGLT